MCVLTYALLFKFTLKMQAISFKDHTFDWIIFKVILKPKLYTNDQQTLNHLLGLGAITHVFRLKCMIRSAFNNVGKSYFDIRCLN